MEVMLPSDHGATPVQPVPVGAQVVCMQNLLVAYTKSPVITFCKPTQLGPGTIICLRIWPTADQEPNVA